jgi:anti-sigma-K factor RskA
MEPANHDLTAAYALDALDAEERKAYEAHLEGCARCREELAAFSQSAEALAVAASGPQPPTDLRNRILAAARAEHDTVVSIASRRRAWTPVLAGVAAAAAVLALALGIYSISISRELDRQRSATAVLADPGAKSVSLQAGAGRLVVAPDGAAVLVLGDLPPAPSGKTYEVWIVQGPSALPAGLFRGREGADLVRVDGAVESGDVIAVTLERAGGVDAPTSPPVVASSPV